MQPVKPPVHILVGWLDDDGVSVASPLSPCYPSVQSLKSGVDELANLQWSGTKPRFLPSLCGAKEMQNLIKTQTTSDTTSDWPPSVNLLPDTTFLVV